MKFNLLKAVTFICFLFFINVLSAQELSKNEIDKIEALIEKKHKMHANNELKSTYRLQIFSGSLSNAKKTREEYNKLNLQIESVIVYEEPNYKVWVGNFRSRIQADRTFTKIKEDYPNALIIKPGK
ncbi:SPOR domain-containing protein [Psychroflexus aestuariivivens]|uniref:SPOR domain-containing protein n=1 Tax=Psychroflexus aestuariivivens TaxID=1795040 RepID=UPI000FDC8840|nr:SPOR domain-containing protein [Psychroflexus aestuariivivens]